MPFAIEVVNERKIFNQMPGYQERLDALALVFESAGEADYLYVIRELDKIDDWEDRTYDQLAEGLQLALIAVGRFEQERTLMSLVEMRDSLITIIERVRTPEFLESFGVRIRHDTASDLANLLRIDPTLPPDLETVSRLLSARTAEDKKIPGKRYIQGRPEAEPTAYADLVWNSGKSVSVLHAFASPAEKALIMQAQRDAVHSAMLEVEKYVGRVRRGAGGSLPSEQGDVVWVLFEHTLSRRGDMHLHTHAALVNVVKSIETDRVGALHLAPLYDNQKMLREVYQQTLAANLQSAGFDTWYDAGRREARIRSIPESVIEAFSQRREEGIARAREYLAKKGIDFETVSDSRRRGYISGGVAATREDANTFTSDPAEWRTRAENLGWQIPRSFLSPDLVLLNTLKLTQEQARLINLTLEEQLARRPEATQKARSNRELEHASRKVRHNLSLGRYHRGGEKMEWDDHHSPRLTL